MKKIKYGILSLSLCFLFKISAPSALEKFLEVENSDNEHIKTKIDIAKYYFSGRSFLEIRDFYPNMKKRIFKSIVKELSKSLLLEDDRFLRGRKKKTKNEQKILKFFFSDKLITLPLEEEKKKNTKKKCAERLKYTEKQDFPEEHMGHESSSEESPWESSPLFFLKYPNDWALEERKQIAYFLYQQDIDFIKILNFTSLNSFQAVSLFSEVEKSFYVDAEKIAEFKKSDLFVDIQKDFFLTYLTSKEWRKFLKIKGGNQTDDEIDNFMGGSISLIKRGSNDIVHKDFSKIEFLPLPENKQKEFIEKFNEFFPENLIPFFIPRSTEYAVNPKKNFLHFYHVLRLRKIHPQLLEKIIPMDNGPENTGEFYKSEHSFKEVPNFFNKTPLRRDRTIDIDLYSFDQMNFFLDLAKIHSLHFCKKSTKTLHKERLIEYSLKNKANYRNDGCMKAEAKENIESNILAIKENVLNDTEETYYYLSKKLSYLIMKNQPDILLKFMCRLNVKHFQMIKILYFMVENQNQNLKEKISELYESLCNATLSISGFLKELSKKINHDDVAPEVFHYLPIILNVQKNILKNNLLNNSQNCESLTNIEKNYIYPIIHAIEDLEDGSENKRRLENFVVNFENMEEKIQEKKQKFYQLMKQAENILFSPFHEKEKFILEFLNFNMPLCYIAYYINTDLDVLKTLFDNTVLFENLYDTVEYSQRLNYQEEYKKYENTIFNTIHSILFKKFYQPPHFNIHLLKFNECTLYKKTKSFLEKNKKDEVLQNIPEEQKICIQSTQLQHTVVTQNHQVIQNTLHGNQISLQQSAKINEKPTFNSFNFQNIDNELQNSLGESSLPIFYYLYDHLNSVFGGREKSTTMNPDQIIKDIQLPVLSHFIAKNENVKPMNIPLPAPKQPAPPLKKIEKNFQKESYNIYVDYRAFNIQFKDYFQSLIKKTFIFNKKIKKFKKNIQEFFNQIIIKNNLISLEEEPGDCQNFITLDPKTGNFLEKYILNSRGDKIIEDLYETSFLKLLDTLLIQLPESYEELYQSVDEAMGKDINICRAYQDKDIFKNSPIIFLINAFSLMEEVYSWNTVQNPWNEDFLLYDPEDNPAVFGNIGDFIKKYLIAEEDLEITFIKTMPLEKFIRNSGIDHMQSCFCPKIIEFLANITEAMAKLKENNSNAFEKKHFKNKITVKELKIFLNIIKKNIDDMFIEEFYDYTRKNSSILNFLHEKIKNEGYSEELAIDALVYQFKFNKNLMDIRVKESWEDEYNNPNFPIPGMTQGEKNCFFNGLSDEGLHMLRTNTNKVINKLRWDDKKEIFFWLDDKIKNKKNK